jgi:hypothetical protein
LGPFGVVPAQPSGLLGRGLKPAPYLSPLTAPTCHRATARGGTAPSPDPVSCPVFMAPP